MPADGFYVSLDWRLQLSNEYRSEVKRSSKEKDQLVVFFVFKLLGNKVCWSIASRYNSVNAKKLQEKLTIMRTFPTVTRDLRSRWQKQLIIYIVINISTRKERKKKCFQSGVFCFRDVLMSIEICLFNNSNAFKSKENKNESRQKNETHKSRQNSEEKRIQN